MARWKNFKQGYYVVHVVYVDYVVGVGNSTLFVCQAVKKLASMKNTENKKMVLPEIIFVFIFVHSRNKIDHTLLLLQLKIIEYTRD